MLNNGGRFAYAGNLVGAALGDRFLHRLFWDGADWRFRGDVPVCEPIAWPARMAMTGRIR